MRIAGDDADSADAQAARALLAPASIAIVGASDRSRWSAAVFDNLVGSGYAGQIHLINPRGAQAHGRACAVDCAAVGEPIDQGLIIAPRDAVAGAVAELAQAGARSAVILTAGFAETGAEGLALQQHVQAVATGHGIRLLGPNCLGYINFTNRAFVWTTPVKAPSRSSGVAIVSQSGATAYFLSTLAHQQDVGLSHVVSTGNEADLDAASFIDCLLDEPAARSIALFAETFRHPMRLLRVAERALAIGKPLVVLKVGASEVTAASAMAHTGALVGDDRVFSGICEQYGIIRVHSMEELLATADIAGRTGVLRGRGLAVVTNSGGVGEIAADTAHLHGIALPQPGGEAAAALARAIPDMATVHNPLDLTGAVSPEQCESAVRAMAGIEDCAAVLCPWYEIPTSADQINDRLSALHRHLARGLADIEIPGFLVSYTGTIVNDLARGIIRETGADYLACGLDRALSGLAGAIRWSQRKREYRPRACAPQQRASAAGDDGTRPRSEYEALGFLARHGVPVVPGTVAANGDEAVAAARALQEPVVIKVASPDIAHKSDIGGVVLNVHGDDAVRAACEQVTGAARRHHGDARIDGAIVAPMRARGIELLVGFKRDPQWGPVLAVGLGGVWVELLKDVALRPLPVDAGEARRMLAGLRGTAMLNGQRGVPAADLDKLAEVIARIGDALLAAGPDLAEADINPLWVRGGQVEALDALFVWR